VSPRPPLCRARHRYRYTDTRPAERPLVPYADLADVRIIYMTSRPLLPFPAGYSDSGPPLRPPPSPGRLPSLGPFFMITASPTRAAPPPPSSLSPQQLKSHSQPRSPSSDPRSMPAPSPSPSRPPPPSPISNVAGIGSASSRPPQPPPPTGPVPPPPLGQSPSFTFPKPHHSAQPQHQRPHPHAQPPPPHPVALPDLLAAHGHSQAAALNALVSAYNSVVARTAANSFPPPASSSSSAAAAKTASENTKLWNWCSSLKSQLASASRENRALAARNAQLEAALRRLDHPLPPPNSASFSSSSSLDAEGNAKRPEVYRSWSDGVRQRERTRRTGSDDSRLSSTSNKRAPPSSDSPAVPTGDDGGDYSPSSARSPAPLASPLSPIGSNISPSYARPSGLPTVNEPPSQPPTRPPQDDPPPTPPSGIPSPSSHLSVTRQHSLRKASSLDLGKAPSPLSPPVRSATPPAVPVSTSSAEPSHSSVMNVLDRRGMIQRDDRERTPSGEMALLPDEARRYILASMGGGGGDDLYQLAPMQLPYPGTSLPHIPPASPLFLQPVRFFLFLVFFPGFSFIDALFGLSCSCKQTRRRMS
jgi:hypothetical protein